MECMVFDASGILIWRIITRQNGQHTQRIQIYLHKLFFFHISRWFWMAFCDYNCDLKWKSKKPTVFHIASRWFTAYFSLSGSMSNWTEYEVLLYCHFFYLSFYCGHLFIYFTYGQKAYLIRNKTPFTMPYILYSIRMSSSYNLTSLLYHSGTSVYLNGKTSTIMTSIGIMKFSSKLNRAYIYLSYRY